MTLVPICICGQGSVCDGRDNCLNRHYTTMPMPKEFVFELEDINLKAIRKLKRLSLKAVEEATGISNPYISQLENGQIKNPSFKTIKTLIEFYGFKITITSKTN